MGPSRRWLERYNKCIAAGDYFEGDSSFMCVFLIKVPIRKKSGNLSYAPRIYIYIYIQLIQESAIQVQSVDEAGNLSLCINAFEKGMNPFLPTSAIRK